jgi:hypothetical protein
MDLKEVGWGHELDWSESVIRVGGGLLWGGIELPPPCLHEVLGISYKEFFLELKSWEKLHESLRRVAGKCHRCDLGKIKNEGSKVLLSDATQVAKLRYWMKRVLFFKKANLAIPHSPSGELFFIITLWISLFAFLLKPFNTDFLNTGSSKKMDGIWNRYNMKRTRRIYKFGVLKCSEKFKVLDAR